MSGFEEIESLKARRLESLVLECVQQRRPGPEMSLCSRANEPRLVLQAPLMFSAWK
jgi:hypothetical protein